MEENNVLTDTEELKILSDLVAIKSVNDNEILVAKYLQKLLGPSYPFAMFGPGNDTLHQVNEYVDEKMYLNFVKIYTELFVAYLNK